MPKPEEAGALWCMEHFDLLKQLSMLEREKLRRRVRTLRYRRGEGIYLPGDPGDTVYFLRRGRVKLDYLDDSGRRLTLRFFGRGEPFGENALAGEQRRRLVAEACDAVELCAISKYDLMAFARDNPSMSLRISKLVGLRLVEFESRLEELLFKDVPTRLCRLLVRLSEQHGVDEPGGIRLALKVTHQDLADLIGARRETTSVVLGELEEAGLIEKGQGTIRVRDPAGLRAQAQLERP